MTAMLTRRSACQVDAERSRDAGIWIEEGHGAVDAGSTVRDGLAGYRVG